MSAAYTYENGCDRCSAGALVSLQLESGGTLRFCGHHGRKVAGQLAEQGATFGLFGEHDDVQRILEVVPA